MKSQSIFNNDILFVCFMISIMLLASVFNVYSIYKFKITKKKISADYIKFQLWIINLVFTFIAIPYFIFKELYCLDLFWCNLFYTVTDAIMFIYNNRNEILLFPSLYSFLKFFTLFSADFDGS